MGAVQNLTNEYKELYSINLQKDKKFAIIVNVMALIIAALMIISMNFFVPISLFFNVEINYFIKYIVLIGSMVGYTCLHELVHGVAMKAFGTKKVRYGFTGMYAFAGSDDYYDKKSYIIIALAPIIVFLFVFAVINLIVPQEWFWIVYFLQVINVSGAAGDLFVTAKFMNMPKDILIKDFGVEMKVYSKQ